MIGISGSDGGDRIVGRAVVDDDGLEIGIVRPF